MFSLVEVFAVVTMVGFGLFAFRRFLRRGSAMAVLFSGLGLMLAIAPAASATEFRKGDSRHGQEGRNHQGRPVRYRQACAH